MTVAADSAIHIGGPWAHRSVSANGTRFHIAEAGDGPLVLLLHGFPEFWWTWRHQLASLPAAGFRAVAADLRGYGGSDKPPRGYDLVTAASDVAGLVRALGEANAIVVGHDWGGMIAWTMAAYFPKVVRRLGIVSAAHPLRLRAAVLSDPRIEWACHALVEHARAHFAKAEDIMARCPRRSVRAPQLMGAVYKAILARLVARGFGSPRAPVRIHKALLFWMLLRHAIT